MASGGGGERNTGKVRHGIVEDRFGKADIDYNHFLYSADNLKLGCLWSRDLCQLSFYEL